MKLHTGTHAVEKSGNFEENQFSIEASAKAFMILSDGLYSNKILAVIRELSTNAYDSHVDAGRGDRAFEVHLPTRLEPFFHVRDFGTSMSHEDCMTLYTTYFRSTRNNSNDAVGCLGLGSKAPFAYSDSFTVEAFKDGEKRIYSAHRGSDGSPSFALLETVPTTEENGIKVSMSVKNDDMDTFRREAMNVYKYFNVRPIVTGNNDLYFDDDSAILEAEDKSWAFHHRHNNCVVMGQIAYNIDEDSIGSRYVEDDKVAEFLWQSSGLRLHVNIGDVDITPSREALSYTPQTKENIRNLLQKVINDIKDTVEDAIKGQPTLFLARQKYVEVEQQCHSIKSAMESLNQAIEWNGQKIFDSIVGNKIKVERLELKQMIKSGWRRKAETKSGVEFLTFNNHVTFFVDDCQRGGLGRIRHYIKEEIGSDSYNAIVYKLKDGETANNNAFLKTLGDATVGDVKLTSALEKPQRQSSGGGSSTDYSETDYYDYDVNDVNSHKVSVKATNVVYIPRKRNRNNVEFYINDATFGVSSLNNLLRLFHEELGVNETFYFMTPSQIKTRKLEERDNWKGPEYFVELVTKLYEKYQTKMIAQRNKDDIHVNNDILRAFAQSTTDGEAKRIAAEYMEYENELKQSREDCDRIWKACHKLRITMNIDIQDYDSDARFARPMVKQMERFPMLNLVGRPWTDEAKQTMAEYIDLVENSSKELTAA